MPRLTIRVHALESMTKELAEAKTKLDTVEHQLETAKIEVQKPFAQEQELAEKLDRLSALNALLNMDEKGNDTVGMEDDEPEMPEETGISLPCKKKRIKKNLYDISLLFDE